MHSALITDKGQVTIPSLIRKTMNLKSQDKVEFVAYDNYIVVIPLNKTIKDLCGILPKPSKAVSCKEMDEAIRSRYDRA